MFKWCALFVQDNLENAERKARYSSKCNLLLHNSCVLTTFRLATYSHPTSHPQTRPADGGSVLLK